MTDWCGGIRATGGLIAPTKTRWFLVAFSWDGLDWQYHTNDSLPGDITLPDKDSNMYTVSREKPSKAFESLGLRTDLCNTSTTALDDVTHVCQEFFTQMNNTKYEKFSCLNAFNTSFMSTLSYRMISTQFTEK